MNQNKSISKWLGYYKPNPNAEIRLFCFPFAGGNALAYRTWGDSLPDFVEVCPIELPGRGARLAERPYTNFGPMVNDLSQVIIPFLNKPFAFFGHSMGAIIAFELARDLRRKNYALPIHLFASGHTAPSVSCDRDPIYKLPDNEFIERLRQLNGTPEAVLENKELMELLIPVLRADFEVNETYVYNYDQPLECPISAYGGYDDVDVDQKSLLAWENETKSDFNLMMFEGDHFFLHQKSAQLLKLVENEIRQNLEKIRARRAI